MSVSASITIRACPGVFPAEARDVLWRWSRRLLDRVVREVTELAISTYTLRSNIATKGRRCRGIVLRHGESFMRLQACNRVYCLICTRNSWRNQQDIAALHSILHTIRHAIQDDRESQSEKKYALVVDRECGKSVLKLWRRNGGQEMLPIHLIERFGHTEGLDVEHH